MKYKIVRVELFFHCREDVDTRALALHVIGGFEGHRVADEARQKLVPESTDYRDITHSGSSWEERPAASEVTA